MKVNENLHLGTTFEFVKQVHKAGDNGPKLIAYPVGRQIAARNIDTDEISIVPKDDPVDQITAVVSVLNRSDQKAVFATGETDYNNPNDLYVDIYEVYQGVFSRTGYRKKVEVPDFGIEAGLKSPSISASPMAK